MRRTVGLLLPALAGLAALVAMPSAAAAAAPGFAVTITELPEAFVPGDEPRIVTAVASTGRGRGCQKVRWSMVLRVNGLRLDQVRVQRVEEDGTFPVAVQADGDTARLTDVRFDPGILCRGRTVTARYLVAVADDAPAGEIAMVTDAFARNRQLLGQARATRLVTDEDGSAEPTEEPTPEPTDEPTDEPVDEPTEEPSDEPSLEPEDEAPSDPSAAGDAGDGPGGVAAVPTSRNGSDASLVVLGAAAGGILIFLGAGLLLRMRLRSRSAARAEGLGSSY